MSLIRLQTLGFNHLSCGPLLRSFQGGCDRFIHHLDRRRLTTNRMIVDEVVPRRHTGRRTQPGGDDDNTGQRHEGGSVQQNEGVIGSSTGPTQSIQTQIMIIRSAPHASQGSSVAMLAGDVGPAVGLACADVEEC